MAFAKFFLARAKGCMEKEEKFGCELNELSLAAKMWFGIKRVGVKLYKS